MQSVKLFFLTVFLSGAVHATVCGYNGTKSGSDSGDANLAISMAVCVPGANSTVSSLVVSVNALGTTNHIQGAVYATALNGSQVQPTGSPLCTTASTVASAGDNVMSITGCGTLVSGTT